MATSNGEVTGVVETTVQVTGDVNPARGTISTGDMLKEIYDTNDDGIVNAADEAATLTDLTATVEELNYSSGLTGNIQDQLDGKADNDDIPTDLADLQDDADHRTVTDAEKTEWSDKSDFSGSYNDLTDKPVIPDAQIQSDWNQSDNTKADFIKNKPTIPAEQVNSDWNASSGKAEILNKPTIPTALSDLSDDSSHRTVTDAEKTTWNSGEANVQSDWNETDTSSDAYIQNKPTIPSVTANPGSTTATLSSIGIDGTNYAISGGGGGGAVDSVNGKTGVVLLDAEDVGALPDDTPLFSGDYEDLTNKPTIPNDLADLNDDSTHRLVTDTEKTTWNGKSDFSGSYNDLSNKPTLGSASALDVASSGDASTTQVVKGDDSRLSDARTPVSHTHTTSDITDFPTMSDYIQKSNTSGLVKNDGTIDTNSYATTSQIPDISGKADKVSGATNGNLAKLDSSGNLADAGWVSDKTTTAVSGNPISISGLKSNQLAINPIITFEPIQAGSGTPSPSNVRAISGYDKVEVESCGKNLCESILYGCNMNAEGYVVSGSYNLGCGRVVKGQTYTVTTNESELICGFFVNKPVLNAQSYNGARTVSSNKTFTAPITGWIVFRGSSDYSSFQFELGSTSTTYEPYHNTTSISESLGQTVYGGTLDLRSGKLTVDRAIVDLGSLTWDYAGNNYGVAEISNKKTNSAYIVSSYFTPTSVPFDGSQSYDLIKLTNSNQRVFVSVNGSQYGTGDLIKAYVQGKYIVYELATPFTIQLTPHEISLLKDYAYVSTNGTNIAFDYHNGEIASLADVNQLGETLNKLGSVLPLRFKRIFLSTEKIGTSFSPEAKLIGSVKSLLGDDITRNTVITIMPHQALLTPAALLSFGFYNNDLYIAASQSTTLSSGIFVNILYLDVSYYT